MDVMIVEDEVLLALELESELEDAGHRVIGQAMSSKDALAIVAERRPDFAFVDIHLLDGPTGIGVGRHLTSIGVPFVFMTGNVKRIPEDFAGAWGAIEKPYSVNGFRHSLSYFKRRLEGKDDGGDIPPSLRLPGDMKRAVEA